MFKIIKNILLVSSSFFFLSSLQADDDGFRITPSVGLGYSYKFHQSLFKPNMDIDITYLLPSRLELGAGVGMMHDIIFADNSKVAISNGDKTEQVPFGQIKKESYPAYIVARYSFDFNETDDIILTLKYGAILTNSKGSTEDTAYDMRNIRMFSIVVGYELDDTIIALDFRAIRYQQYVYFLSDANSKFENNEINGYFGIALQHRFNLF